MVDPDWPFWVTCLSLNPVTCLTLEPGKESFTPYSFSKQNRELRLKDAQWILGSQKAAPAREGALVTEPSLETRDCRNVWLLPKPHRNWEAEKKSATSLWPNQPQHLFSIPFLNGSF